MDYSNSVFPNNFKIKKFDSLIIIIASFLIAKSILSDQKSELVDLLSKNIIIIYLLQNAKNVKLEGSLKMTYIKLIMFYHVGKNQIPWRNDRLKRLRIIGKQISTKSNFKKRINHL